MPPDFFFPTFAVKNDLHSFTFDSSIFQCQHQTFFEPKHMQQESNSRSSSSSSMMAHNKRARGNQFDCLRERKRPAIRLVLSSLLLALVHCVQVAVVVVGCCRRSKRGEKKPLRLESKRSLCGLFLVRMLPLSLSLSLSRPESRLLSGRAGEQLFCS